MANISDNRLLNTKLLPTGLIQVGACDALFYGGFGGAFQPEKVRDLARRAFARMREMGMGIVNGSFLWQEVEPERGVYWFDRMDILFEQAETAGLQVQPWIAGDIVPNWWKTAGLPPFQNLDGARLDAPCIATPEFKQALEAFIQAVVCRYREHPRLCGWQFNFENSLSWIMGREPETIREAACTCPVCTRGFQQWLKSRYSSLDSLNQAWNTRYQDWRKVDARGPGGSDIFINLLPQMDWRRFMVDSFTAYQKLGTDLIRQYDPKQQITCHVDYCATNLGFTGLDMYAQAATGDILGVSLFPMYMQGFNAEATLDFRLNQLRSASGGRPIHIQELTGGISIRGINSVGTSPTGNDIARYTWQMVAHGAKSIFYWDVRPHRAGGQLGGFGLLDFDLSHSERSEAVRKVTAVLQHPQFGPLLHRATVPVSSVAMIQSQDTRILSFVSSRSSFGVGTADLQLPTRLEFVIDQAFRSHHLGVDYFKAEQLGLNLSAYRLVCLPCHAVMTRSFAKQVKEYVGNGGNLIVMGWCAMQDEFLEIHDNLPGAGLDEVCGCVVSGTVHEELSKAEFVADASPVRGSLVGDPYGLCLRPIRESTRVLARYPRGEAAVTLSEYGSGRVLCIGPLVQSNQLPSSHPFSLLLGHFTQLLAILPPIKINVAHGDRDNLLFRTLQVDDARIWVLANCGRKALSLTIQPEPPTHSRLTEIYPKTGTGIGGTDPSHPYPIRLGGEETMLLLCESK